MKVMKKEAREEGRKKGREEAAINTILFGLSDARIHNLLKKAFNYDDTRIDELYTKVRISENNVKQH